MPETLKIGLCIDKEHLPKKIKTWKKEERGGGANKNVIQFDSLVKSSNGMSHGLIVVLMTAGSSNGVKLHSKMEPIGLWIKAQMAVNEGRINFSSEVKNMVL